jgi:hypothetical protein
MAVLKTTMVHKLIEVQFGTDTGTWAWNDTSSWSSDTTGLHDINNGLATLNDWPIAALTFVPSSGGDIWNIFDGSTSGVLAFTMAGYEQTTGGAFLPRSMLLNGLRMRPVFSKASSDIATTTSKMIFTLC